MMNDGNKLNSRIYSYAFNYFNLLIDQIKAMQSDLEIFLLDLEDACESAGEERREALLRIEDSFKTQRERYSHLMDISAERNEVKINQLPSTCKPKPAAPGDSEEAILDRIRHYSEQAPYMDLDEKEALFEQFVQLYSDLQ